MKIEPLYNINLLKMAGNSYQDWLPELSRYYKVLAEPEIKLAKRTSVWQGTNLPYLIHDSSNSLDFAPTNFEDVLPGMLPSYQPS